MILLVTVGPLIYTTDAGYIDVAAANSQPSMEHPMGTDNLGRDTLARVMAGGRISMAVGVVAMLIAMFFGTMIGLLAGYFNKFDSPLMRITDMFLALPQLPLLLV